MAEFQLVILREAQELSRVIHQLESYVANPQPSTILVVCYKYKSLDKRKKLYKSLQGQSVLFESKKLYENQVPDWIQRWAKTKKRTINLKASHLLVECLGTHLSAIEQSLEKLILLVDRENEIPQVLIHQRGPALQDQQIQAVLELGDGHFAALVVIYISPERFEFLFGQFSV